MGVAEILIVVLLGLTFVSFFVTALYCRVQEKMDVKRKKRNEIKTDNTSFSEQDEGNKKLFLKRVYWTLYGYLYGLTRYNIIMVGKLPSYHLRNWLYRLVFNMKITGKTVVFGGCEFRSPWNFYADNCVISNNCILDARNGIKIGQNVVLGSGVHIWTEEHDVNDKRFRVLEKNAQPVVIEKNAWICSDSTILPGVHIEEGCVLASKGCATKDCAAFGIFGGVPAKKIGDRNNEIDYELSGKSFYHFW